MIIELSLYHYKNYSSETVRFTPGLNFLVGQNGMGKTNLLDAIYYLCMAKSHSTPMDRDTVQFNHPFLRLEARVSRDGTEHTLCVKVKPGEIKEIEVDGKTTSRLSDFIGFLPVIMLSPEDIVLIQGGSIARRRFMDVVLCQSDREYLEQLQRYNKLLAQRNALLKSEGYRSDRSLLLTYSKSMTEAAKIIHERRGLLAQALLPDVQLHYAKLSDARESPGLEYMSHLHDQTLETLALESIEADLQHGRTTKGIHRDDLDILLDTRVVKRFGSQGQIKSLLIALHLAQTDYLKQRVGVMPVLLLDDIFDRLDDGRARRLIGLLTNGSLHQVFISDASPARVSRLLSQAQCGAHVMEIDFGTVHKITEIGSGQDIGNLHLYDDEEE